MRPKHKFKGQFSCIVNNQLLVSKCMGVSRTGLVRACNVNAWAEVQHLDNAAATCMRVTTSYTSHIVHVRSYNKIILAHVQSTYNSDRAAGVEDNTNKINHCLTCIKRNLWLKTKVLTNLYMCCRIQTIKLIPVVLVQHIAVVFS